MGFIVWCQDEDEKIGHYIEFLQRCSHFFRKIVKTSSNISGNTST